MHPDLQPERLLSAYSVGVFPMADDSHELHWLAPDPRAILELDDLKVTRSMRALHRKGPFKITINRAFERVIEACADRHEGTWISKDIQEAYFALHQLGFAHSVEAWLGDKLAGGLYGVCMGGAFFGESMFYRVTDASKMALMALVERMKARGLSLLDVQFMTEHLDRLGAIEITRKDYERRLQSAIGAHCCFDELDQPDDMNRLDETNS